MSWFLIAVKKYAVFSGRATRKEYWFFWLFYFVFLFGVVAVADVFGRDADNAFIAIVGAFILAMVLPSLAVTVRRLHDIGRSGWWTLIRLVPIAGSIVMLVFTLTPSEPGENRYGPNPLTS